CQERMMAIVEPGHVARFAAICARWDVPATVIGEVTGTGRLEMTWRDEVVVDIAPETAASQGPVYDRPAVRPAGQDALAADGPDRLPRPAPGELGATLLALLRWPDLADKTWVTEQYDRHVLGDTVLAAPENAGVIRIDERTGLGVALAVDGNGRYCRLDPYAGAQLALAEAYRNVAATGARPLAVTDCLNFGSPADPAVIWQFEQATAGLAGGCAGLGVALAESCLRGGLGCRVALPGDPFTYLFSESAARAVVAVRPGAEAALAALAAGHDVPAEALGAVGGGGLLVEGCFEIPLDE